METRIGLFTPDQEIFLATALSEYFTFKNKLLEVFDKTIFKLIVKAIDNDELDKINLVWKADLIPIVDAAIAKNLDEVTSLTTKLLEKRVSIPGINIEIEALVYDSLVKLIISIIVWFVNKEKNGTNQ